MKVYLGLSSEFTILPGLLGNIFMLKYVFVYCVKINKIVTEFIDS